ncbi:SDR family NAD(P)-dependent oxidoreductase [Hymenobacter busanensis]|uniref:SDR family NAD(P)-dependent oxidoreductase n=1 Tax=Hymenobacter busanensis TaxID=2607656 RepID=A0A7L4ZUW1_9BACT|nr:SDR family NAD(P)-dependent oxidoreductase [Hymenobacter busanensis]KAA9339502.1 SDR family NAD(P)-dependent oxidoreductase [Hymenobacter busanensis]QHJ06743.1 SDR family NAD(P)-dependent oxidoreductase [Hymenobacter busanensis]
MKTTNHTVLITGGGSGIGLAIARLLSEQGNQVIITGRNEAKLQQAAAALPGVTPIAFDVNDAAAVAQRIEAEFGGLSLLINNAGYADAYELLPGAGAYAIAEAEIHTNYLAIVRLTEALLPVLTRQPEAAVVNVSSIVAFVPSAGIPTYAASKAALHSYTQSLRHTLSQHAPNVKVFDLMPPLVDTELSAGIGGASGIAPRQVAEELLTALAQDTYEIHVGQTAGLYQLFHADPAQAFATMNSSLRAAEAH